MSYDARNNPASDAEKTTDGFSWDDPHGFHPAEHDANNPHSHEEHHVSSWQLNLVILFILLFFTLLTVYVAKGEVLLTTYTDFPITQLWNVIIAMAIATVKAMFVCMYFMHLRHDKPLNTMVMLVTFATLGMFMAMPAIDVGSREAVKDFGSTEIIVGGSGAGMTRWNGEPISGSIVVQSREAKIAEVGPDKFWNKFYDYKAHYKPHKETKRHPADETNVHAQWIAAGGPHHDHHNTDHAGDTAHAQAPAGPPRDLPSASRTVRLTGLTPGLFDATPPAAAPPAHSDHDAEHQSETAPETAPETTPEPATTG